MTLLALAVRQRKRGGAVANYVSCASMQMQMHKMLQHQQRRHILSNAKMGHVKRYHKDVDYE